MSRRVAAWGAFLAVVLGLRAVGIGQPPPDATASIEAEQPVDEGEAMASQAFAWLLEGADLGAVDAAARRCLGAGAACTPDDMLSVDTARARLDDLASELREAADPASASYVGRPSTDVALTVEDVRAAAASAAEAIGGWLTSGCGSDVEGLPVAQRPATCSELSARALRLLSAFQSAVGGQ